MQISACLLYSVIVLNLWGVGLLIVSQKTSQIVRTLAESNAILSDGSQAAKTFSVPPVSTYLKFYFFDLQNLIEVQEGATPRVVERGPYTFRTETEKSMTWNDTEITYDPKKTYYFVESESKGRLNDTITSLHPGFISFAKYLPLEHLFHTATVDEFLFRGIPYGDGFVGYFIGKNGTSEGAFTAFTGQGDIEKLNQIISYKGKTATPCEDIRGTNGERFSPFLTPPAKLTLYSPQLCRPWDLYYSGDVRVNSLDCVRYANGRDFFSQTFNETLNKCFEEGMDERDIGLQGIFDPQICNVTNMAPVLYSLPHFFNADLKLLKDVEGLEPSKDKHNFYVDVYPALGTVQDMRIRVQVNFRLVAIPAYPNMQEVIYPVFWQEMMLSEGNSNEAASIVYKKVELPKNALFWVTLSLGALSILIGEILLLTGTFLRSSRGSPRDGNDPYVTYNSTTDRTSLNLREPQSTDVGGKESTAIYPGLHKL